MSLRIFKEHLRRQKTIFHKLKLIIILVLLALCGVWYFKDVNFSNVHSVSDLGQEIASNSSPDTTEKKALLGAIGVLTAAGGYEAFQIWRDHNGNEVASSTPGAKITGDYVCGDFKSQPEAQGFFEKAGGVKGNLKRLDGDKNGVACQALPKVAK